jgi:hypothetical protein
MAPYYRTLLFAIPEPKIQREVMEAFCEVVPTLCKVCLPYSILTCPYPVMSTRI